MTAMLSAPHGHTMQAEERAAGAWLRAASVTHHTRRDTAGETQDTGPRAAVLGVWWWGVVTSVGD